MRQREEREVCTDNGTLDALVVRPETLPHIERHDVGLTSSSQLPSKDETNHALAMCNRHVLPIEAWCHTWLYAYVSLLLPPGTVLYVNRNGDLVLPGT